MTKPTIIGLTGSIGMGKSTVAAMFAEAGIPVFDADAEVRAMQGPGGELVPAIEAAFPGSTGAEGVDRDRLGHQVFADKPALHRLEAIVHPAVAARRAAFLAAHEAGELVALATAGTTGGPRRVVRSTRSWLDSFPAVERLTGLDGSSRVWVPGRKCASLSFNRSTPSTLYLYGTCGRASGSNG
jgi:hypothetical protein